MPIEADKRKALEARRQQLQENLARQEMRDTIAGELSLFDQRGIACRVIYETDPYVAWMERHFALTGFYLRVDWSAVEGRLHLSAQSMDEAPSWLDQLAGSVPEGDGDVVLLWGNANSPAVEMKFADLVTCPEVITSDFETWVISEKGGWLIEYTSSDGLNFGRAGS